jgi:beta-glucosidase
VKPFLLLLVAAPWCVLAQQPAYLNPDLPREQRVDDLVSRMTLEEKASQLVNQARAIPRLDVPAYDWWSEALHGVAREGFATVFPQAIGLGATWDAPLIHEMANVIGIEARAHHHDAVRHGRRDIFEGLTFWSPNINIFRDPRWGRGQETYGEDPFLTAHIGVAFVTGLQGDDPKYLQVVATPKHYAVHSGPEPLRHAFNAEVSKHDMEDTYLPAFRATVTEGKAESVMCAYNRINGEPACANTFLLKDELRGAWGFHGYVVSDCDAVADIWRGHHYTKTLAEAAAVSLKMGTDNDCADFGMRIDNNLDYMKYVDAVKRGLLTEQDIDVAVKRLFRARFALGMFDPPAMVKYAQIPMSANDTEEHRLLALKVARESMVLLKNDGVLPLPARIRHIAVVGPLADSLRVLEGNYNGTPSQPKTPIDGIRRQFASAKVVFAPGTKFLRDPVAVPGSALSTAGGELGLKAEYFNSVDLSGKPIVTRVDPQVNFRSLTRTVPALDPKGFSVRWSGELKPSDSGTYTLAVTGGDTYRFWLDGKVLIDNPDRHGMATKTADVKLERGRKYGIRLEYFHPSGTEVARLSWMRIDGQTKDDAIAAAKAADVVIAVVGITADLEGEEMKVEVPGFSGGDRTSIDLPKDEEELLEAVKGTGKPLIVVLMNGSPLAVNWAGQNANAILEAWYPGEEGGTAIAETLAGTNNPAGRLPLTFYKSLDQVPAFTDYSMKSRTYRYFQGKPLYPFGYGLSYSKFLFGNLKLSSKTVKAGVPLEVDAEVRNASPRDGDAVAELYLSFPQAPGMPIRALRGFTRVHVAAGATQRVHFKLDARDLSSVTEAGARVVAPGSYWISVGGGQPGMGGAPVTETQFTVEGEEKLPE